MDPIKQFKKPRTLTCCVCGRDFGLSSLKLHYPKCIQKFQIQQAKKPKPQRKETPEFTQQMLSIINSNDIFDITIQEIQEFNLESGKIYNQKALVRCDNCNRTFLPDSFQKHKKNCVMINGNKARKSSNGKSSLQKSKKNLANPISKQSAPTQQLKKPKVLVCHVCGRQFGLTSLQIHQKRCQQKFVNQESKKQATKRKKLPIFNYDKQTFDIKQTESWSLLQIQQYNAQAMAIYRNQAMAKCPICDRKFFDEALEKHIKFCVSNNMSKKPQKVQQYLKQQKKQSSGKIYSENLKKPKVLMCHMCGRQFGLTSLQIHQKKCKQKFLNQQLKKPRSQRKKVPMMPDDLPFDLDTTEFWTTQAIEQYNKIANQVYRQQGLYQCHLCHRKFFEDALKRHLNFCQKQQQRKNQKLDLMAAKARSTFGNQRFFKKQQKSQKKLVKQNLSNLSQQQDRGRSSDSRDKAMALKQKKQQKFSQQNEQGDIEQNIQWNNDKDVNLIKNKNQSQQCDAISQQSQHLQQTFKNKSQSNQNQYEKSVRQQKTETQRNQFINSQKIIQKQHQDKEIVVSKQILRLQQKQFQKESQTKIGAAQHPFQAFKISANNNTLDHKKDEAYNKKQISSKEHTQNNTASLSKQSDNATIKGQEIQLKSKTQLKQLAQITQQQNKEIGSPSVQLISCKKCNRKFNSDRIQKHYNVCKGTLNKQACHPSNQVQTKTVSNFYNQQEIVPAQHSQQQSLQRCQSCNRKFNSDRIQKHRQVCMGKKQHQKNNIPIFKQSKKQIKQQAKDIYNQTESKGFKVKNHIKKGPSNQISNQATNTKRKIYEQSNRLFEAMLDQKLKHASNSQKQLQNKQQKLGDSVNHQNNKNQQQKGQVSPAKVIAPILNLSLCQGCKRKFAEDRIDKHRQVCAKYKQLFQRQNNVKATQQFYQNYYKSIDGKIKQQKQNKQIPQTTQGQKKEINQLLVSQQDQIELKSCQKCQRKFNVDRILKHQETCKGIKITLKQKQNALKNKLEPIQGRSQNSVVNSTGAKYQKNQINIDSSKVNQIPNMPNQKFNIRKGQNNQNITKHQQMNFQLKNQYINIDESVQLKKTKQNFYDMIKDLKKKKKNQQDIDRQLQAELSKIKKTANAITTKNKLQKAQKSFRLPQV